MKNARWTPAEDEQLRKLVHLGRSNAEIADTMERTALAVYNRRRLLGVDLGESPYNLDGTRKRKRRSMRKYERRIKVSILWGLFTWYA